MHNCNGRCGVDHEYCLASKDVQCNINQYGHPILIRFHTESTVTRDRYNSIKNRKQNIANKLDIKALPITYAPTDKQKSKAGIREKSEVIIWTAMRDWTDSNYEIKDLNTIKADVIINGETFEIVDKSLKDQFGENFLYVVLGLNVK